LKNSITIDKSFFKLGGHSLKAVMLTSRINKHFVVDVSLEDVFDKDNIKKLSDYIVTIRQITNAPREKERMIEIAI